MSPEHGDLFYQVTEIYIHHYPTSIRCATTNLIREIITAARHPPTKIYVTPRITRRPVIR